MSIRTKTTHWEAEVWCSCMARSHPYWYQHQGKENVYPGKGLRFNLLEFPNMPHIPAQGVNRRKQGPHRSGEWVTGFSCTSPNKNKRTLPKPLSSRLLELSSPESTWLSCHKDPTFSFCCLPCCRLFNICPAKDPLSSCVPSPPEIQSLRIIQSLRLHQDSLQRSPWAWPTVLSWPGLA